MNLSTLDRLLAALKSTPRTGWMLRGVHAAVAESIAEHLSESTILALYLGEQLQKCGVNVDVYRAAVIAAVHDIAEAIIGDIVKYTTNAMGKKLKENIEANAIKESLDNSLIAKLALEYVNMSSKEAELAKIAEQLSTLLQAKRYIVQGHIDVCEIATSMALSIEAHLIEKKWDTCLDDVKKEIREVERLCRRS
jgi:putative hydrolase of HD superfamily